MQNDITKIFLTSKLLANKEYDNLPKFSKPKYKLLKRLSELVTYESQFTVKRTYLCDHLGITYSNLNITLKPLIESNLIEFWTPRNDKKIEEGFVKVVIHPRYCWSFSNRKTRDQAIREWLLLTDYSECSKTDITLHPEFQEVFDSI